VRVKTYTEVEGEREASASGVLVRKLISEEEGAPNFITRQLEVDAGGNTPHHAHPWKHEVYILDGEGVVKGGDEERKISGGDTVYLPPDEEHQFVNTGAGKLTFICVIPQSKDCIV
jgi:quercetin dioxygenase-like cupin family protein